MKHFVIFLTSILQQAFTYNGATGNYSDGTKYSGGISPGAGGNSNQVTFTATTRTVTMDVSTTLNKIIFNNGAVTITVSTGTAKTITMGGATPNITSNGSSGVITAGVIMQNALYLNSASSISIGKLTSNGYTLNINNAASKNVTLTASNTGTMVGGTVNIQSGFLIIQNATALNGASGPTINLSNGGAGLPYLTASAAIANNVSFTDIGTQPFELGLNSGSNPGTYTGSISHDLYLNNSGQLNGTWSGFSTSANIIVQSANIVSATFPTNTLQIGDASSVTQTSPSLGALTAGVAFTNNMNVVGKTGSGTFNNSLTGGVANMTLSGNIVLNSNQTAVAGQLLTVSGTTTFTLSGVISNAASNAANMTLAITGAAPVRLTGTNTYTSPTTIATSSELQVNGSNSSTSQITLNGAGSILSGKGTVGPVTMPTSTSALYCYSKGNSPSTADVLTINGNLSMGSTTSKFHTMIAATNAAARLQVNGNVTFSAGCNCVIDSGTASGTYTIMTITGTWSGTLANPTVGTGSSVNGTLAIVGQNLILTV